MYSSLKSFVSELEKQGELIRVSEFVDPILEIAEVTRRIAAGENGGKAVLFENTGTRFPVLTNLLGSRRRVLMALGLDSYDGLTSRIDDLIEALFPQGNGFTDKLRLLPALNEVSSWVPKSFKGSAPCHEAVQYNAHLSQIPLLKCHPHDAGRLITRAMVATADPNDGKCSLEWCRLQAVDDCSALIDLDGRSAASRNLAACTHRLPVAVFLGGDPAYALAAGSPLPPDIDGFTFAGFLRRDHVDLVDCFTQNLKVPSDCEFVIEGYIQKSEALFEEGPFCENTGFHSPRAMRPKLHVTCISHRHDAIWCAPVTNIPPNEESFMREASLRLFTEAFRRLSAPSLKEISVPLSCAGANVAFVRMARSFEGEPFLLANSLWGSPALASNKFLVMVDRDVDVSSTDSVLKAVAENCRPDIDVMTSRAPSWGRDHAAPAGSTSGRLCIDATSHGTPATGRSLADVVRVAFDPEEIASPVERKLWLIGCNCDALRDSSISGGVLSLDARSKMKMPGLRCEWPDIVSPSEDVRAAVDCKWPRLGISL